MAAAYQQVALAPESRDLTSFITEEGLYRSKRVCFGLASAPSVFQKMMVEILQDCKKTLCYIDNIIAFRSMLKEHDANLQQVLQCTDKSGLKLNDKCIFRTALPLLGHVVSDKQVRPLQKNVAATQNAPAGRDALRSFFRHGRLLCKIHSTLRQSCRSALRTTTEGYAVHLGHKKASFF